MLVSNQVLKEGASCLNEQARQMDFFGPEVNVPMSASIQDKLLGLSGRQP